MFIFHSHFQWYDSSINDGESLIQPFKVAFGSHGWTIFAALDVCLFQNEVAGELHVVVQTAFVTATARHPSSPLSMRAVLDHAGTAIDHTGLDLDTPSDLGQTEVVIPVRLSK